MSTVLAKNILWVSPSAQSRRGRHGAIHQAGRIRDKSNDLSVYSFRQPLGLLPGLDRQAKLRGSCKEQLGYSQTVVFQPIDRSSQRAG
jgi:hypothetical protein